MHFAFTSIINNWTKAFIISSDFSPDDSLGLHSDEYSLLIYRSTFGLVQVCCNQLILCNRWQVTLSEEVYNAVVFDKGSELLVIMHGFDFLMMYKGSELMHVLRSDSEITGICNLSGNLAVCYFQNPKIAVFHLSDEIQPVRLIDVGMDIIDIFSFGHTLLVCCLGNTFIADSERVLTVEKLTVSKITSTGFDKAFCVINSQNALISCSSSIEITPIHTQDEVLAIVDSSYVLTSCSEYLLLSRLSKPMAFSDTSLNESTVQAICAIDCSIIVACSSKISKFDRGVKANILLPKPFTVSLLTTTETGVLVAYCEANDQSFLIGLRFDCNTVGLGSQLQVPNNASKLKSRGRLIYLQFSDYVKVYGEELDSEFATVSCVWEGFQSISLSTSQLIAYNLAESGLLKSRVELIDFEISNVGLYECELASTWLTVFLTQTCLEVQLCTRNFQRSVAKHTFNSSVTPECLVTIEAFLHVKTSKQQVLTFILDCKHDYGKLKKTPFEDLREYNLTEVCFTNARAMHLSAWRTNLHVIDERQNLIEL